MKKNLYFVIALIAMVVCSQLDAGRISFSNLTNKDALVNYTSFCGIFGTRYRGADIPLAATKEFTNHHDFCKFGDIVVRIPETGQEAYLNIHGVWEAITVLIMPAGEGKIQLKYISEH
jgi:hypothetical protein